MGHKNLIDGVGRDTTAGRCLVDGVGYSIKKGRTLVDGVGHDVAFGAAFNPEPVLNDNDWETIHAASDAGVVASLWSVGDTKTIVLNGTAASTSFSNLSVDVFIIGIDHNSAIEGNNRIHFKIGKKNGSMVALNPKGYEGSMSSSGYCNMNTSQTTSGGWKSCAMRNTVLGNSGTPTSPVSGSFMAILPSDLRAVMKSVTKYTNNKGKSNSASDVTGTEDYLFLESEFELIGDRAYASSAEKSYQKQYQYYVSGNITKHLLHTSTWDGAKTWIRSPYHSYDGQFCSLWSDGSPTYMPANYIFAVAPCFCV